MQVKGNETLFHKQNTDKRTESMAQVVERLSNTYEALASIPSTEKNPQIAHNFINSVEFKLNKKY